jgi:hypothetical protein
VRGLYGFPKWPLPRPAEWPQPWAYAEYSADDKTQADTDSEAGTVPAINFNYNPVYQGHPGVIKLSETSSPAGLIQVAYEGLYYLQFQFFSELHANAKQLDFWLSTDHRPEILSVQLQGTWNMAGLLSDPQCMVQGLVRLWPGDYFYGSIYIRFSGAGSVDRWEQTLRVLGPIQQTDHYWTDTT